MPATTDEDLARLARADNVPVKAVGELLLTLIGHLYDRKLIDPQAIVYLLQRRVDMLSESAGDESLCAVLVAYIDWLDRIGTGLKRGEQR
jgi:hypothetical protein